MKVINRFLISPIRVLSTLAILAILLTGCEKDRFEDTDVLVAGNHILTIQQAKDWYTINQPIETRTEDDSAALNIVPLWDQAILTKYRGIEDIVLVPFDWDSLIDLQERGQLMMAFYLDPPTGEILSRWFGYYSPLDEYPRPLASFSVNDFSGYLFQIDKLGYLAHILRVQQGVINGYSRGGPPTEGASEDPDHIDFRCDEWTEVADDQGAGGNLSGGDWCCFWPFRAICCPDNCPSAGGSNRTRRAQRIFGRGGGGGNGDGWSPPTFKTIIIPGGYFFEFGRNFNSNPTRGEIGSGGGISLNQYFNNQLFTQTYDPQKVQLVEQFRANHRIGLSVSMLMPLISPDCFDEPESFDDCALWSMANWAEEHLNLTPEQRNILSDDADKLIELVTLAHVALIRRVSDLDITTIVDAWFEVLTAPNEEEVDDFYEVLTTHGINPLAVDVNSAISAPPPGGFRRGSHWWSTQELTPAKVWELAGHIKQDLINRHPSQLNKINQQFPCQVLGPALEEAVMLSLGSHIPRNWELNGCKPDGFYEFKVYDIGNPPVVPMIIEVKGRFSTADNPVFNYSSQLNQFNCYLNYLQNNTYRGHETGAHGLYLILPSGITVAQSIVDACTAKNIPLYLSDVVYKNNDPTQIMVGKPRCVNINSINLSGTLFPFMARIFATNHLRSNFRYNMTSLRESLLRFADEFASRLAGNLETPCPED